MLRRHRVPETLAPTRMPVNFTMYRRGPGHTGRPGEAQPVPTVATASRAEEDTGAGASIPSVSPHSRSLPAWGGPRDTFGIVFSLLVREAQGILKTENTCAGLITERVVMLISLVLITFPRLGTPLSSQDLFPAPAQHGGGKGRRIPGAQLEHAREPEAAFTPTRGPLAACLAEHGQVHTDAPSPDSGKLSFPQETSLLPES